jgi:glycerate-2-kinase
VSSNALERLFLDAVAALDPRARVADWLRDNPMHGAVDVLALGKAARPMVAGAREALGDAIECVCAVVPDDGQALQEGFHRGSHPRPDACSEQAGRALLQAARRAAHSVLALISGGGSALAAVPAPGLSLEDKAAALDAVYKGGAPIAELNAVRKHLSAIKGGRLALACPQPVLTLVVSDVVGDDLSAVASGPTVADETSFAEALGVVERYAGSGAIPPAAARVLREGVAGEREETPAQLPAHNRVELLAGMSSLVESAAAAWPEEVHLHGSDWSGDVQEVADRLVALCSEPGLHLAAGEATIRLCERPGIGGRAHHMALLVARAIAGDDNVEVLVAGSDGIDGNARSAGAIVDGGTWGRLQSVGVDPEAALRRCDSATALEQIAATLHTGATGVNHADLFAVLVR